MKMAVVGLGLALGAVGAAVIWYLARVIQRDVFRVRERNEPLDLQVVDLGEGTISLRPLSRDAAKEARRPGTYGFQFDEGYAQVGPIVELPSDAMGAIRRAFTPGRGTVHRGTRGRLDSFTFEADPASVGLEWEPVEVTSAAGSYPAWHIAGDSRRWVIFVHGKGARPEEALRVLPAVHGEGWSCLAIAYRNDSGHEGDGVYRYGVDEWEDLEAAVQLAQARGAVEIVLAGYSMGGAIVLSFLARSELANAITGLILDAPMTDLETLLEMRLREWRIPAAVARTSIRVAGRRARVKTREADYHGQSIEIPVLVIHGDNDDVIPIGLSERFAAGRENVRLLRVAGAGHVRSWNVDREAYEAAVREFLQGL